MNHGLLLEFSKESEDMKSKLPWPRPNETDDHLLPALFAGLYGGKGNENIRRNLDADDWQPTNMCNSTSRKGAETTEM